ncbi:hypothetical protein [Nocardioides alkalitolerans]|uniref:hypothetical protein n=1 Tax=Nocardioides alkalitolerans TaxID=281714 RepID=UPI000403ED02|nr:hypothetical protein [Nocardioides alkalitolerans]
MDHQDQHEHDQQDDQQQEQSEGQVSEVASMGDAGADATIYPEDATAGYPTGGEGSPQSTDDGEAVTRSAGEGTRPDEGTAGPDAAPHQGG